MRFLHLAANVVVTLAAVIGVISFGVWVATVTGRIQPLVVVSGSMRPQYEIGDLIIATPRPASEVSVGEAVTVPDPEQNGTLVTHRVVSVGRTGDDTWTFVLKGDDNAASDPRPYVVSGDVLQPALDVPFLGAVVDRLRSPRAAAPLGIGLVACLGLTVLQPAAGCALGASEPAGTRRIARPRRAVTGAP
ncbi:signal peptidase I [Propionicicella superfundia]|uniref:signal peptidase I n=1 Tax=Propionicicella superfundia TaxID=348582 RepID=UPI00040CB5D2|nr:signal peptidase I [Propionicicella superfundia]